MERIVGCRGVGKIVGFCGEQGCGGPKGRRGVCSKPMHHCAESCVDTMCREFFKSQQFALRLLLSTVISCKDIVNIIVDFIPIFETFQQSFQEEHKDILQNIQAESYKR